MQPVDQAHTILSYPVPKAQFSPVQQPKNRFFRDLNFPKAHFSGVKNAASVSLEGHGVETSESHFKPEGCRCAAGLLRHSCGEKEGETTCHFVSFTIHLEGDLRGFVYKITKMRLLPKLVTPFYKKKVNLVH